LEKEIMKKLATVFAVIFASLVTGIGLHAQMPPGFTNSWGGGTNYISYTNSGFSMPYVPGLKLSIRGLSGTNLPINLLEADPAGTYDIFAASNLISAPWNDLLGGTNGQTNFTLPFPFISMGYFRAARTDTPVVNTAGMTAYFPNNNVNTNLISAIISGGPAAAMAVLVNDTNLANAVWIPFSAVPYVLLGTNDGTYQVTFGFIGLDGQTNWTSAIVTLDATPPLLVITRPTNFTTSKPMLQLQGYSPEPLTSLAYNVTNSLGIVSSSQGLVTGQYFDTNLFDLTTNWFECLDVGLTLGTNYVSIQATDRAGNVTLTNLVYVFDTNGDMTTPAITLFWPQDGMQIGGTNFTLRGLLDDETANVTVQTVDTNGTTNVFSGLVERDGNFWAENLPLSSGTNFVTISATDFAGNTSTTNLTLVQSAILITIASVPSDQLHQLTTTVTGTVNDPSYSVSVNGVSAFVDGGGNWTATGAPINAGTTACFDVVASSAGQSASNQSATTNKPPYVYVQSYNYKYASSVSDYSLLRALPITENFSMSWAITNGGTEDQNSFNLVYYTNVTLNLQIHTAWPTDSWPLSSNGVQTTTGNGVISVATVGPPSLLLESCITNGIGYFGAGGGYRTANYSRSAKTIMSYFTGGKSVVLRKNLHQLNVNVNQQDYTWYFGGGSLSTGDAITNGVTAGDFGAVSNGVVYKLLPDGTDANITPQAKGVQNYNFTISSAEYVPVNLSLNTSGTNLTSGDNLHFPTYNGLNPYGVPTDQLGKVTPNNPFGCQGYFGKTEIIGQVNPNMPPSTTFVFGQTRDYYILVTFKDGTSPLIDHGNITEEPMNYQKGTINTNLNIFAIDSPGFVTGINPTNIATIFERQNFTTYTKINGYKCSNDLEWHNQTTTISGLSTPTDVDGGHVNLH